MKESTTKSLADLDVQSPDQLVAAFAELRADFERDAASVSDDAGWKTFRDAWLGRKSGVIANITDNWLKKAPTPELKKGVGQALNEFGGIGEGGIEGRRLPAEAAAEQAALARERIDLSLPGVMRPIGTRHPVRQTFQ